MKKIFIDCGSHFYQGFKQIAQQDNINSSWDCYSFEANPITFKKSENSRALLENSFNVKCFCKAVSTHNQKIKINAAADDDTFTNQGSNILDNPPSKDIVWGGIFIYDQQEILTECFSLSDFLKTNVREDDYCLIKMDIEGSEFQVLDDIIDKETYKYISKIYVEFHERFFPDINKYTDKKNNYKKFFTQHGINFIEWY